MSAPLRLTSDALRDIAAALDAFTKVRLTHGVELGSYGHATLTHMESDVALELRWDNENGYEIDDRSGS